MRFYVAETVRHAQQIKENFARWYGCLEEVWQPGYSLEYREYRLREALGLVPDESPWLVLKFLFSAPGKTHRGCDGTQRNDDD